jgi:hypothetical protein
VEMLTLAGDLCFVGIIMVLLLVSGNRDKLYLLRTTECVPPEDGDRFVSKTPCVK